jgi:hypothetical protein
MQRGCWLRVYLGCFSCRLGLQSFRQDIGNARVERAITTSKRVDKPAGLRVLLCDCRNLAYDINTVTGSAEVAKNS